MSWCCEHRRDDWLEKPGPGNTLSGSFKNEITPPILPDLTDADLRELEFSALSHRRLLLRGIAALDNVESGGY